MHYQTRVMVALQNFLHGSDPIRKDEQFVATEIDANYLYKHKRAAYAPAAASLTAAPVAAPAPVVAAAATLLEPATTAPAPAADTQAVPTADEISGVSPTSTEPASIEPAKDVDAQATAESAAPAPATRRGRTAARNTSAGE